jgi:hypothetical protein
MIGLRKAAAGAIVASALLLHMSPTQAQAPTDLDQNWSQDDLFSWYDATQGSRLIPYSWLKALEQPGGTEPFLDDAYIARFRYIPGPGGSLPIGFAIDNSDDETLSVTRLRWKSGQKSDESWVGFNCAACHTGEMTYNGARLRVEGGPALADFQGFMETLNRSLIQTRDHPGKFARFATRVLGDEDTELNRESLRSALGQLIAWQNKIEVMNKTELRYGYGRLDAFGHIFNKVALIVDAARPEPNPANAPVRYPVMWNVPQLDYLQWNAMAPKGPTTPSLQPFDVGALARNTGEVIGVFGDIRPNARGGLAGFVSSVNIASIVSLEQLLGKLRPPAWPAVFPAPAAALIEKGKALYQANCQDCHSPLDRTDLTTKITVKVVALRNDPPNRTDPWMACNAYLDQSQSGVLTGMARDYLTGDPLPAEAPLADLLATTVLGVLAGKSPDVLASGVNSLFGRQPPPVVQRPSTAPIIVGGTQNETPTESLSLTEQRLVRCLTEDSRVLGYKARPLTGIWASAPYLHNRSIPTLWDLLSPMDQRPPSFWVGTREFDPDKVGYVTTRSAENSFLFRTRDLGGNVIDGNSNAGHLYGVSQFTDDDRGALIAYLKTL